MGMRVTTVFGGVGQGRAGRTRSAAASTSSSPAPAGSRTSISQRQCFLDRVEVTVLDEADHMADLGFLPAVKRLLDQTPAGTQRLLFSATLDNGIDVLVQALPRRSPVVHSVDPVVAPVAAMTHHVFAVGNSRQARGRPRARRGRRPQPALHPHQARVPRSSPSSSPPPASRRSSCTATSRRTRASATSRRSPSGDVQVLGRHRHRRSRHPRRRHRTRRPRRSAGRAQGVPAPLRPHRARRRRAASSSR